MVFSDPIFVYVFMPAVLLVFWAGAWKVRTFSPFLYFQF